MYQQVTQSQQACTNETVAVQRQGSGAGAAMGAIAGGALGNGVGDGGGRAVATLIGIIGGAMVGDRVEGRGQPEYQTVQRCTMQPVVANQLSHYNVLYEYAGKQYSVQLPQDPGPTIQLQVTPVGSLPQSYAPPVQAPQAIYTAPPPAAVVVPAAPVVTYSSNYYPYGYVQPVRPPVGVNLQFGYSRHDRHYDRHYDRPYFNDRR